MSTSARGLLAAILAYAIWGLIPVYWKLLTRIGADELLYSRLVLTALTCLALLPVRGSWPAFRRAWGDAASLRPALLAAALLAGNWFSFMWAVNNNRVMESSLGYFLCPIVSVLLGRFAEGEEMGRWRWAAVALAAGGVYLIIAQAGFVPVAAIVIALTWGGYGLMKKRSGLGPLVGLGVETWLLTPMAAVLLAAVLLGGSATLETAGPATLGVLLTVGLVTISPLLLFAYAAKRVRLSTMGMGQYIVPSSHFGLAVLYGEPVTRGLLAGFALIWAGLVVYSLQARLGRRPPNAVDSAGAR